MLCQVFLPVILHLFSCRGGSCVPSPTMYSQYTTWQQVSSSIFGRQALCASLGRQALRSLRGICSLFVQRQVESVYFLGYCEQFPAISRRLISLFVIPFTLFNFIFNSKGFKWVIVVLGGKLWEKKQWLRVSDKSLFTPTPFYFPILYL